MFKSIQLFFNRLFAEKKILELSYSKISAFRFCPWKYKLIYIDGKRVAPNPAISLGHTIHKTLEQFHKNEYTELDELLEIYNHVWVNEGFQSPQQTVQYYEKGEKMLQKYIEWNHLKKSKIIAVEKEFRFRVGSRILRGIIDRVDMLPDDTYEVIDYKTHAEMWAQSRIDADLQLTLYSIGCEHLYQAKPASIAYLFLAHDQFVQTTRSKKQKQDALDELEQVAKKIENNKFIPDTSMCPKCDFRSYCKYSTVKNGNK